MMVGAGLFAWADDIITPPIRQAVIRLFRAVSFISLSIIKGNKCVFLDIKTRTC
ncbi:hypothetical protein [Moraxella lacunata]|uniref:hypothetical protein n=1 Tax=Moraxella lacunata TaxID=477 RepID=UPI003EE1FF57